MEEEHKENSRVRIFVGGLGESVTPEDLHRLFGSLGTVEGVETIRTKGRSFAYVDFVPSPTDEKSLPKLFSKYNGCLWKGGKLRLEKAKEHYLVSLKREWENEAELAIRKPSTNIDSNKGVSVEKMPNRESSKIKQLNIFFPELRKVKSIPFWGTGKHKYSFQNIKVPPLPVHFCDCEEHCSPSGAERGKLSFDVATESGGMNDDEINIMNTVMSKLFEKGKVSNTKHLEKEQVSSDSTNGLPSNEVEVDSATDDDDLIINVETKKNTVSTGFQELERILENQESWLNKTRISKEEPKKSMLEVHKRNNRNPNKKRKSLPNMENESNRSVSTTTGCKGSMHALPDVLGSGVQPAESKDRFVESTKVSWSQKSSWRELLGGGGNTAFSSSLILPKFDSREEQHSSDGPCTPNKKTEDIESNGCQGSKPTNAQEIKDLAKAQPTDTRVIKELAEAHPTGQNATLNKTGRGASWRQKQSWTKLVSENNNSFSISQIMPGITFQGEPMVKESVADPSDSNDCKLDDVAKQTTDDVVDDGFNLGKVIPEKSEHAGASGVASVSVVEEKIRGRSTEETIPREKSSKDVDIGDGCIGDGCSFMRSAASLREWEKAKAALSKSLKRKRSEK